MCVTIAKRTGPRSHAPMKTQPKRQGGERREAQDLIAVGKKRARQKASATRAPPHTIGLITPHLTFCVCVSITTRSRVTLSLNSSSHQSSSPCRTSAMHTRAAVVYLLMRPSPLARCYGLAQLKRLHLHPEMLQPAARTADGSLCCLHAHHVGVANDTAIVAV